MWGKFQKALQMSPWFLERGTITGRTNLVYQPNKDIKLDIGSTEEHALSVAVMFCLDGQTKVLTENGFETLSNLNNQCIRVYTENDDGSISLSSEPVFIKQTNVVDELYEIKMENGYTFRCTPEHKMKLSDGSYKMAKNLTLDDDLELINTNIGIYRLYNRLNGKSYIGQSKQINTRIQQHYNHPKKQILEDIGSNDIRDIIKFEILECCAEDVLDEREQYYISKYNSLYPDGYNRQTGGKQNFTLDGDLRRVIR